MEENTIIEEGKETVETAAEELTNPALDAFNDLPTIVEESGNGDIQVLPLAIGIGIGGAIVLGVRKIYKMIKEKKSKYLTPDKEDEAVEDADPEIDEVEEK